jgi:hypothetical protein
MANFPWEPVDQGRPASEGGPASQSDDAKFSVSETQRLQSEAQSRISGDQHPNQVGSAP